MPQPRSQSVGSYELLSRLSAWAGPTRLLYLAGGKIDLMVAPVVAVDESPYDRPFRR